MLHLYTDARVYEMLIYLCIWKKPNIQIIFIEHFVCIFTILPLSMNVLKTLRPPKLY